MRKWARTVWEPRWVYFSCRDIMACKRAKRGSCSVFGSTNEPESPLLVPPPEQQVCGQHPPADCSLTLGQHRAGPAARLNIKSESEPTLLGSAANLGQVSPLSRYHGAALLDVLNAAVRLYAAGGSVPVSHWLLEGAFPFLIGCSLLVSYISLFSSKTNNTTLHCVARTARPCVWWPE